MTQYAAHTRWTCPNPDCGYEFDLSIRLPNSNPNPNKGPNKAERLKTQQTDITLAQHARILQWLKNSTPETLTNGYYLLADLRRGFQAQSPNELIAGLTDDWYNLQFGNTLVNLGLTEIARARKGKIYQFIRENLIDYPQIRAFFPQIPDTHWENLKPSLVQFLKYAKENYPFLPNNYPYPLMSAHSRTYVINAVTKMRRHPDERPSEAIHDPECWANSARYWYLSND